jgi:hypothetical protein
MAVDSEMDEGLVAPVVVVVVDDDDDEDDVVEEGEVFIGLCVCDCVGVRVRVEAAGDFAKRSRSSRSIWAASSSPPLKSGSGSGGHHMCF